MSYLILFRTGQLATKQKAGGKKRYVHDMPVDVPESN
jgi:hypothetical protein